MLIREVCPACGSNRYKKKGHTRHGKQHHQSTRCERQCGATAEDRLIADERRTLVAHLRRERIALRGICRAVGVSLPWLLHCMVARFAACPDDRHVRVPQRPTDVGLRRLAAEAEGELRADEGQHAMERACHGCHDPPEHRVACGGSSS